MARGFSPTALGLYAMLLYPIIILGYDGILKFVLHRPTITADVTSTREKRVLVCLYLSLWTLALVLHFGFLWFDG